MAFQFPQAFDPTSVAPATGGGNQLPVSDLKGHLVVITESEVVPVANKPNAAFIKFDLAVIEGEHKGAEGTYRVNYFSDSEVAANIAKGQLSALAHVCGIAPAPLANTAQLHNRPFRVVVGLQKDPDSAAKGYTEIKFVLNQDGSKAGTQGASAPPAAAAPPTPPAPPAAAAWTPPAEAAPAAAAAPAWGSTPAAAPASNASVPPWAVKP
jgi:hypothetical protein